MLSPDSDCAADRTCEEAEPVSLAPRCTSVMLDADLRGALRGLLDVARNFLRRGALLFHRAAMVEEISDIRPMVSPISLIAPTKSCGRGLDAGDLLADLAGRLGGLLGERLHFGSHHREAAAGFAGARRLDRGIQRQQIGLSGNGVDQLDDVADPRRRL